MKAKLVMGSESNSSNRHYNPSMSKRTRRPLIHQETYQQNVPASSPERESASEVIGTEVEEELAKKDGTVGDTNPNELAQKAADNNELARNEKHEKEQEQEEDDQHQERQGLNGIEHQHQLTNEEKEAAEEERHLPMVTVQRGGEKGAKLGRMVRRYMKVFSHLIKANKESHLGRKNRLLQLTM